MKYYNKVPGNFLLLRFVATRFCNFRCPYCYVPIDKREINKTMFSHHTLEEWIKALEVFKDRHIELYFTGGEPTLSDDFILFLKEMIEKDFVRSVRIDSNLSRIPVFLKTIQSSKIKFLASFHPSHISLERFQGRAEMLRDLDMMGLVNVVASRENVNILKMIPHELVEYFDNLGCFLNVAKDFHRGLRYGYDETYREYIDKLQHPFDNEYMNLKNINKGMLCGVGKHYVSLSRHGNFYSCGGSYHGNLFVGDFKLPGELATCIQPHCPSIISYSFSSSNDFSPVEHLQDYVQRNREYRKGLNKSCLDSLWHTIEDNDLMPKDASGS